MHFSVTGHALNVKVVLSAYVSSLGAFLRSVDSTGGSHGARRRTQASARTTFFTYDVKALLHARPAASTETPHNNPLYVLYNLGRQRMNTPS